MGLFLRLILMAGIWIGFSTNTYALYDDLDDEDDLEEEEDEDDEEVFSPFEETKKFSLCSFFRPSGCAVACKDTADGLGEIVYASKNTPCTQEDDRGPGWCNKNGSCVNYRSCDNNSECEKGEYCREGAQPEAKCVPIGNVLTTSNGYLYSDIPMTWEAAKNWCEVNGSKMARMPRDCCNAYIKQGRMSYIVGTKGVRGVTSERLPDSALAVDCARCGVDRFELTDDQKPLDVALNSINEKWHYKKISSRKIRLYYSFWLDYYKETKGLSMAQLHGRGDGLVRRSHARVCKHNLDSPLSHRAGTCDIRLASDEWLSGKEPDCTDIGATKQPEFAGRCVFSLVDGYALCLPPEKNTKSE